MAELKENKEDYKRQIFELTGQISMCWENISGAGTFKSDKAIELTEQIIDLFTEERNKLLKPANDILRSCYAVIERKGTDTNWEALKEQVGIELERQHKIFFSEESKPEETITIIENPPYNIPDYFWADK